MKWTVEDCLPLGLWRDGPRWRPEWRGPEGVALAWTPCYFGGSRPWLVCPQCGARRLRLYEHGGLIACRACLGLSYACRRERRRWRVVRRARKLRLRLGGGPNLLLPCPERPARMHVRTFLRLVQRYGELQGVVLADMEAFAARVGRSVRRLEARWVR